MDASRCEVVIHFMGPVRRPPGVGLTHRLPLPDGTTVDQLLAFLGFDSTERSRLQVIADGHALGHQELVDPHRDLTVFLPLGGG